jgi:hypothetical protein
MVRSQHSFCSRATIYINLQNQNSCIFRIRPDGSFELQLARKRLAELPSLWHDVCVTLNESISPLRYTKECHCAARPNCGPSAATRTNQRPSHPRICWSHRHQPIVPVDGEPHSPPLPTQGTLHGSIGRNCIFEIILV